MSREWVEHGENELMKEQHGFTKEQSSPKTDGQGLQAFGNYDLVRRIDVGGMGEVYLARQRTAFGREVAVKIIRPDLVHDVTARKRFLREAEVSAYLKHDHILPLFEFGEEQGRLFLVTPYIKGGTLATRLQNGPLSRPETHRLFTALVEAVAYLHKRGVIHRDLKPSNILLDREEDSNRVYVRLIDFGIASLQGLTDNTPLTRAGHEIGTAAYMAPERLDGVAAPSNDIYSLGIILYQMVTGRLPSPEEALPLPKPIQYVIRRCTAINPQDRFASADELLVAFEQAYQEVEKSARLQTGPRPVVVTPVPTEKPEPAPSTPLPPLDNLPTLSVEKPSRTDLPVASAAMPSQDDLSAVSTKTPSRTDLPALSSKTSSRNNLPVLNVKAPSRDDLSTLSASTPSQEKLLTPRSATSALVEESEQEEPPISSRRSARLKKNRMQNQSSQTLRRVVAKDKTKPRTEVVLPPLPSKGSSFSKDDYNAPTTHLDPGALAKNQLAEEAVSAKKPPRLRKRKKRSFVAMIAFIILAMSVIIGLLGYMLFEASITANVTVGPRVQAVSSVFTLTAKPGQKSIDAGTATIPAGVLTSTQKSSLQGQTTGVTGCVLGIFDCKKAVSYDDINNLAYKIEPGIKTQIQQDLQKQAQSQGVITVGNVFYSDETVAADPPLNSQSDTVTVTVSEKGSMEYIKAKDAHDLAVQLLRKQLLPHYTLLDSLTQVSQPVVQALSADGSVTLKIAAGGVQRYQIPDSELTDIQNHIKGMTAKDVRALLAKHPNLDPNVIAIHISYGNTIPSNVQQIKVTTVNPMNMPPVQLTPLPTPTR